MRVLVAFGSKRGGTAGLADMIGNALVQSGHQAVVSPADGVYDLTEFDAVIVAGALYANRWHRQARRFVRRNVVALHDIPVWLVSSGPLDDSAEHTDIPPTKQVANLAALVNARGHATFGGRLSPNARGFIAGTMAKTRAGDWRNPNQVTRWVESLLPDLDSTVAESRPH